MCRPVKSHALGVRHTHLGSISRSHAQPYYSHAFLSWQESIHNPVNFNTTPSMGMWICSALKGKHWIFSNLWLVKHHCNKILNFSWVVCTYVSIQKCENLQNVLLVVSKKIIFNEHKHVSRIFKHSHAFFKDISLICIITTWQLWMWLSQNTLTSKI